MTARLIPAPANGSAQAAASDPTNEPSELYKSAVRFTRLYATFSPTMTALLVAKKTRYGRYIPLPDALPDGFTLGKLGKPGLNGKNGHAAAAPQPGRAVACEVVHHVPGRIRFTVPRLAHDRALEQRLTGELMALPQVKRVRASASSRSLVVEYLRWPAGAQPGGEIVAQLVACIHAAIGIEVAAATPSPPQAAVVAETAGPTLLARTKALLQPARWRAAATAEHPPVFRPMALPALSLGLSAGMAAGLAVSPVLMGGLVLLASRPIVVRAMEGIRSEKRLTVEVLDATTIALMVSQASFLAPSIIVSLIEGAQVARNWTARPPAQLSLEQALAPSAPGVHGNGQTRHTWSKIAPGDKLTLRGGDPILADGLVLGGVALVDQRRVTGEASPVVRRAGDTLYAGSAVVDGRVQMLAQRTGHDTAAGQAVALLQAAPETDTRLSNYARMVGNWAVLPTLLVGGAVYVASGSVVRATGIVNLDLGTGMRVSSPAAYYVARARAARLGIQFRSGRALEMLAAADTWIIDRAALGARDDVIERLQEMGLDVRLVESQPEAVQPTASGPASWLESVRQLQADGRTVAFVGHGIGAVAAMRQAQVSLALESAGELARAAADVALTRDDLGDLLVAVALARHTVRLLRQDMRLVTATNVAAIGYGVLTPVSALTPMLINNGSWVLATLNSLRPWRPGGGAGAGARAGARG